jgi:hypothetical protein
LARIAVKLGCIVWQQMRQKGRKDVFSIVIIIIVFFSFSFSKSLGIKSGKSAGWVVVFWWSPAGERS